MAGSQSDPASLMRVLMKHNRMEQAAAFALQFLTAWQTQVRDAYALCLGSASVLAAFTGSLRCSVTGMAAAHSCR
jgi:hypothetical protein